MSENKKKISFTPKHGTKDIFRDTTQIGTANALPSLVIVT